MSGLEPHTQEETFPSPLASAPAGQGAGVVAMEFRDVVVENVVAVVVLAWVVEEVVVGAAEEVGGGMVVLDEEVGTAVVDELEVSPAVELVVTTTSAKFALVDVEVWVSEVLVVVGAGVVLLLVVCGAVVVCRGTHWLPTISRGCSHWQSWRLADFSGLVEFAGQEEQLAEPLFA